METGKINKKRLATFKVIPEIQKVRILLMSCCHNKSYKEYFFTVVNNCLVCFKVIFRSVKGGGGRNYRTVEEISNILTVSMVELPLLDKNMTANPTEK